MLRLAFYIAVLGFFSTEEASSSREYCNAEHLVFDRQLVWDFGGGFATQLPLPTHRMGELAPSFGKANFGSGGESLLWTSFENIGADPWGLEYTVYKLEITIGDPLEPDNQLIEQDFSVNCTDTGFGIDYGKRRKLPPIRIEPRASGAARGLSPVRVRIWGWQ